MIELDQVSYAYPGAEVPAVRAVSLQVAPGEVLGIVGPNGSGKSTLGRLMKGLLLPEVGRVMVDGLDTRTDGLEVWRRVGLLFQNPNSQIVNAVVEHEVAFGPENLGLPAAEIEPRVREALAAVGLTAQAQGECHGLSMANKQRVALAAVLAMRPQYLILDEPTAWLEPGSRWPLLDTVLSWGRRQGVGIVLITHRMDEAEVCQRVVGIRDGRLIAAGPPGQVLNDAAIRRELALEVPEAYVLGERLQAAGLPVQPGEPVPHMAESLWRS